jgi:peptide/nickel transport system permease protein
MVNYIIRRILIAIPTLFLISVISFVVITLPKGDYLDQRMAQLQQQNGDPSSLGEADALRHRYGLDKPLTTRYVIWVTGFIHGDFGQSFRYQREVKDLIGERILFTVILSLGALLFTYALAIPIGIYSATHRYQWTDNVITLLAFIGMSLPGFLVALVIIVLVYQLTGTPLFDLFSPYYQTADWS